MLSSDLKPTVSHFVDQRIGENHFSVMRVSYAKMTSLFSLYHGWSQWLIKSPKIESRKII